MPARSREITVTAQDDIRTWVLSRRSQACYHCDLHWSAVIAVIPTLVVKSHIIWHYQEIGATVLRGLKQW